MGKNRVSFVILSAVVICSLLSCKKRSETDGTVDFTIYPKELIVLPTSLSWEKGQTCDANGVTGPRVRIGNIILNYHGSGKFIPLVINVTTSDGSLASTYKATLASGASDDQSLSFMFWKDATTKYHNFIPKNAGPVSSLNSALSSGNCYFELGTLPTLRSRTTNIGQATLTAKLTGLEEDDSGNQTPITATTSFLIRYVDGSTN